jgi:hypothetical protein
MESNSSQTVALTNPAISTATAALVMVLASSVTAFFVESGNAGEKRRSRVVLFVKNTLVGGFLNVSKYSKAKETLDAVRRECGIT